MNASRHRRTGCLAMLVVFALGSAGLAGADGEVSTEDLRPTEQELSSPAWWVDQAMREAGRVEDPKERADAFWETGVTGFNAGRFDVAWRVLGMDLLGRQQHETLGSRLLRALEKAGDVGRLIELADRLRPGFQRERTSGAIAKLEADGGDLDGAERRITRDAPESDRQAMYADLSAKWLGRGNWQRAWDLALLALNCNYRTPTAAHAMIAFAEAAARAGHKDDLLRATERIAKFAKEWDDGDTTAADLGLDDLARILRGAGLNERAAEVERILPPAPPEPPDTDDEWLNAIELAEHGQFEDAVRAAEGVAAPGERAYSLASIASLQALRDRDAAAKAFTGARSAFEASLAGDEDYDFTVAHTVALAAAVVGDYPACWAVAATTEDEEQRNSLLERIANERAAEGDVAFTRAAMERQPEGVSRDVLRSAYAMACAKTGDVATAAEVAAAITEPYDAFGAYCALAIARAAAGDVAGFDDAVRRARAAMERENDHMQWGWSLQRQLAVVQAHAYRPPDVWESVRREQDPKRRVTLMLAAADGLIARVKGEPPY